MKVTVSPLWMTLRFSVVQMDFQYRGLAKQMMQFEKAWVTEWAQTVNSQATYHLKQVQSSAPNLFVFHFI